MNKLFVVVLCFLGCGGKYSDMLEYSDFTSTNTVSYGTNDSGTKLSVTMDQLSLTCWNDELGGTVNLDWTVLSTAAADSATITLSVDGDTPYQVGEILSGQQGWVFDGRTKTATVNLSVELLNGNHTLVMCVTQDGANGRLPKTTCSESVTVVVDCNSSEDDPSSHCNQGLGNGSEGCDPGNSNNHNPSNDETGGTPGDPGR